MRPAHGKFKFKKDLPISTRELLSHLNSSLYTRQTLVSLFRTFLENVIEDRLNAVVVMKIANTDHIESVISRLNYSPAKVYVINTSGVKTIHGENFHHIELDSPVIDKEEFLVVMAEKFSAMVYWSQMSTEVYGLLQGAWSFNPGDSRQLADYLAFLSNDSELKEDLNDLKADRRYDERFTTIMTKLVTSLENRQRDLICANKELKELHDKSLQNERLAAIGQVSSVIAHELRNPLGLIDLYAKILLNNLKNITIEDPEQQEIFGTAMNAAETIKNSTGNLEKILSELLNYSKPLDLDRTSSDLRGLVEEVYNLIQPSAEEKNIGLKLRYNVSQDVEVKFDWLKLNQALLNVVKNAIEASKAGDTVYINVDCRSTDGTVYIKVSDSGKGVTEDHVDKLFTPYFSTKPNGTGLGLAHARKVLKAHNGDIELLSTSPNGTTFALILPGKYSPISNIETF